MSATEDQVRILLRSIADFSVQVAEIVNGRLNTEAEYHLLEASSLVTKYFLLACLPKEYRLYASEVTLSEFCPLCHLRKEECGDCVFSAYLPSRECNRDYLMLRDALINGHPMEVCMNLIPAVQKLLSRFLKDNDKESCHEKDVCACPGEIRTPCREEV